jgi:mannose-1-phosphate guanylyltransferase/phosphomannomutase
MDGIGNISYASDASALYSQAFLKSVDQEAIRGAGFNIVVDYAFASTSQVLADVLQALGVNTTPLGARVDPTYISLEHEIFEEERRRLAVITQALGSDLGVRLDVGGEKVFLADDCGRSVPDSVACAVMVELALRSAPGGVVAVPINLSSVFERIARQHQGSILRTPVDVAQLMQAAHNAGVLMAADGAGAFVFPDFQPVVDGMMAVARLLQMLAQHKVRLSEIIDSLPPFHVVSTTVDCSWDNKATVMRRLQQRFAQADIQITDGIKIFLDEEEWVLARPDPDRPVFHVTAEAASTERAAELADDYGRLVATLASSNV